jgi:hypothetical protein
MSWIFYSKEWFKIVPLAFDDEFKLIRPGERRQLIMKRDALRRLVVRQYGLS